MIAWKPIIFVIRFHFYNTAMVVASKDKKLADAVQQLLASNRLRISTSRYLPCLIKNIWLLLALIFLFQFYASYVEQLYRDFDVNVQLVISDK